VINCAVFSKQNLVNTGY